MANPYHKKGIKKCRFLIHLYCPSCGNLAAQADDETNTGWSASNRKGKVESRSNLMVITCGACKYDWTAGRLKFEGYEVPDKEVPDGDRDLPA